MRYYLYRDIELLKEIYSQFTNMDLDLDVIERIDAKSVSQEEGIFTEPETKIDGKCDMRVKIGARTSNSSNVTTISEYANMEDIKDIHNKRFYHNLIDNLTSKKIKCKGLDIECGKINCMRNEQEGIDKFVEVNGTYIWYEYDKLSNDIHILSTITDKITIIGCVIKEKDDISPKIIKAIAMYIDT